MLASLRIEREQSERTRVAWRRRWWLPLWSVTAVVLAVVAVWVWQSGREARPRTTAKKSAMTQRETAQAGPIKPAAVEPAPVRTFPIRTIAKGGESHLAVEAKERRDEIPLASNQTLAATPKLDQFPSPQPLSEQEQILMSYVAKYPEKAALIAQARAEALQRDREEELAEAAKDTME